LGLTSAWLIINETSSEELTAIFFVVLFTVMGPQGRSDPEVFTVGIKAVAFETPLFQE
jgi:hypothetical protein